MHLEPPLGPSSPWLSGAKRPEEREFYLRMAVSKRWNVREVARQIDASAFERAVLTPPKLSTVLRDIHPTADREFKDAYFVEFAGLAADHSVELYLEALDRDIKKPHERSSIGVLLCATEDTSLEVENFKGIAARQRIEFARVDRLTNPDYRGSP